MTKLTIDNFRKIAKDKGGQCLSSKYLNTQTKLSFKCKEGHVWETMPINIEHYDTWCPHCAKNVKLDITAFQEIAKNKGGECLSNEYIDLNTKLTFKCKEGHVWKALPKNIRHYNSWCPHCAKNNKLDITVFQKIAEDKDGKCLSNKYVNIQTKLSFKCKEGHIWEALPNNIRNNNTWCPICARLARIK